MADFLSALMQIPNIISAFNGSTSNPYGKQERQQAANMAQISSAMTDTSNPLYKQLYGQYQDQNRQSMAQSIAEAQAQNRMQTGMGRTPLFDPNRGGETIFRNMMQGYQGMGAQSDQQTRAALGQALGGSQATGNYYGSINSQAARAGVGRNMGYNGVGNILQNILSGNNNNANNVAGVNNNNISGGYQSPYAPQNQTPNANLPYGVAPTSNYNPSPYGQYQQGWAGN